MRRVLPVLGVLLLVAAAALTFIVVPSQAKFPDDVDATSIYEGTLDVRFDTGALARGDLASLFVTDTDVTITNDTVTVAVDGDLALVETRGVVTDPTGEQLQDSDGRYAIDRVTMVTTNDHGWPDIPVREPGLVVGFPIGTEARDYEGWSDTIGQLATLQYERAEERAGVETLVFTRSITNQVVVDPATLALVPEALPKDVVVALAGQIELPPALAGQLDALLPLLPDPVPLGLTYTGSSTYWVEPTTGVVIDLETTESRAAYLDIDLLPIIVPVVDVWSWTYAPTAETVADSVVTAQDAAASLRLYGTTLPLLLVVAGSAALAGGFVLRRRDRADVSKADLTDAA